MKLYGKRGEVTYRHLLSVLAEASKDEVAETYDLVFINDIKKINEILDKAIEYANRVPKTHRNKVIKALQMIKEDIPKSLEFVNNPPEWFQYATALPLHERWRVLSNYNLELVNTFFIGGVRVKEADVKGLVLSNYYNDLINKFLKKKAPATFNFDDNYIEVYGKKFFHSDESMSEIVNMSTEDANVYRGYLNRIRKKLEEWLKGYGIKVVDNNISDDPPEGTAYISFHDKGDYFTLHIRGSDLPHFSNIKEFAKNKVLAINVSTYYASFISSGDYIEESLNINRLIEDIEKRFNKLKEIWNKKAPATKAIEEIRKRKYGVAENTESYEISKMLKKSDIGNIDFYGWIASDPDKFESAEIVFYAYNRYTDNKIDIDNLSTLLSDFGTIERPYNRAIKLILSKRSVDYVLDNVDYIADEFLKAIYNELNTVNSIKSSTKVNMETILAFKLLEDIGVESDSSLKEIFKEYTGRDSSIINALYFKYKREHNIPDLEDLAEIDEDGHAYVNGKRISEILANANIPKPLAEGLEAEAYLHLAVKPKILVKLIKKEIDETGKINEKLLDTESLKNAITYKIGNKLLWDYLPKEFKLKHIDSLYASELESIVNESETLKDKELTDAILSSTYKDIDVMSIKTRIVYEHRREELKIPSQATIYQQDKFYSIKYGSYYVQFYQKQGNKNLFVVYRDDVKKGIGIVASDFIDALKKARDSYDATVSEYERYLNYNTVRKDLINISISPNFEVLTLNYVPYILGAVLDKKKQSMKTIEATKQKKNKNEENLVDN